MVREYIDEARSATTDDRPGFLQMISDLRNGVIRPDLVLLHKLDRFARNRMTRPFTAGKYSEPVLAW
ncbi:recombinase family protein [Thermanaeromonas sp. C210]|uniref:recombinase family protein n=1 Tax=Thermanaeromonas sp. C210 TaxID=2731925 RepID=UPI001C27CB35